jgi:cystathionine beta-lyase/cystathionine gamma-synthase
MQSANPQLQESINDLLEDCDEVLYLLKDTIRRLEQFLRDMNKNARHIPTSLYPDVIHSAKRYIRLYSQFIEVLRIRKKTIVQDQVTIDAIVTLRTTIQNMRDFLRTRQGEIGALITSTDWQSPSFLSSQQSQAGRQTGTIYETINDYKRDQHWDARKYELQFLKEYIDAYVKFPIRVLATSSGMAAFTIILNFLLLEQNITRPVLMGKSIYFENKKLIKSAFGDLVEEVDENDTQVFLQTALRLNPSVIFLDSLTNAAGIAAPDLNTIIKGLLKQTKDETYCIIDNTCLSVYFQPFRLLLGRWTKLHCILFESLNKYHEFGMDRVTGGVLWGFTKDMEKLFDYRVHLGTNIPDTSAASLPSPNKALLVKRLMRHNRNASLLAEKLQSWISAHPSSPFQAAWFPGLSNHPSYRWMHRSFCGSYLTIEFRKRYQKIHIYKRFIRLCIKRAKQKRINLVSGTSFGLNTTRIYLTAIRTKPVTPFVRIAVGIEDRLVIEVLSRVFLDCFSSFRG